MDIKTSTNSELTNRKNELETKFNKIRDELAEFIKSTHSTIESKTTEMDKISAEYKQITEELCKRNGVQ